jgi:hypothetical protein
MSEKKPTIEELEKKISGIKNTKSRMDILTSLVRGYEQDIYNEYQPKIAEAEKGFVFKNESQKKDVEQICAAIRGVVKEKYKLRYDVVCKIADANTLTFVLDFNYETVSSVVAAKKNADLFTAKEAAANKKLANWNRKMLFRVANGEDFTDFKSE